MAQEGAPEEKLEREPVTDEQCVEAMKAGDFEKVREWYAEQEKIANENPDQQARRNLQLRYAKLQIESGLIDDDTGESYAIPTLEALRDSYPAEDDEKAYEIQDVIDTLQKK